MERLHHQKLFAYAPYGYITTDAGGVIREVNRAAAKLLGAAAQSLVGKPLSAYMPAEERRTFHASVSRLLKLGDARPIVRPLLVHSQRGPRLPVAATLVAMLDSRVPDSKLLWMLTRDDAIGDDGEKTLSDAAGGRDLRVMRCGAVFKKACVALNAEIAEHRRIEVALQDMQQFAQEIIDGAAEGIVAYDSSLRYVLWNRFLEEMTGVRAEEVLGKYGPDIFPHMRENGLDVILNRALQGEVVTAPDILARWPQTGKQAWMSTRYAPHRDALGNIVGAIALVSDISERKQMEQALRRNESNLAGILASLNDVIWSITPDTFEVVYMSPAAEQLYGRPVRDFHENRDLWYQAIHPQDRHRVQNSLSELLAQGSGEWSYRIVRPDGGIRWVRDRGKVICDDEGRVSRLDGIITDVTAQKLAEEALRESEERFRDLTELSMDWYWEQDAEFRFTLMSDGIRERARLDPAEYTGKRRWELPYLDMSEDDWARHRAILEAHQSMRDVVVKRIDLDGNVRYLSINAKPIFDAEGRFKGYRGTGRDLTEQIKTQEALKRSEARYRHLVEDASDMIYACDPGGHCLYVNTQAVFRILGYTEADLIGHHYLELVRPDWRPEVEQFYRNQFYGRVPSTYFEFPVLTKDGREMWVGQNVQLIMEGDWIVRLEAIARDITERKRMELELADTSTRLRKLSAHVESVREEESAKIAREVHDLLGGTLTMLKLGLATTLEKPAYYHAPMRERLQSLLTLTEDSIQIVRKISSTLRPAMLDTLGLVATIRSYVDEFSRLTGIQNELYLPEYIRLPPQRATAVFRIIQEALTNVARHSGATLVTVRARKYKGELTVRIADNGSGFSESDAGGCAKSDSFGLLGMRERALYLGGKVDVKSVTGDGTTVIMCIPLDAA